MITLNSTQIWQWDTGHTVTVDGADSVHFAMPGDTQALVVEPTQASGVYTANVPNILLQRFGTLTCWRVIDGKAEQFAKYEVNPRPKPSDYVYEETTVDDYQQIKEWFTDSVEELEADYTAAIAEVEAATDSATDAAASANAAASAAQSAIDAMTGNVLRGTVGPSEVVGVDDAYPQVPLGVKVKGVTRQNLWVNPTGTSNGITVTENDDGSVTVSGTATAAGQIASGGVYTLKPGTTYTASGTGRFTVYEMGESGSIIATHTTVQTFTTSDQMEYCVFAFYFTQGSSNNGTYRVMLNEGSEAEPWCPPGLNSVEGLEIWSAGKNLLRKKDTAISPSSGVSATVADDGSISLTGTSTGSVWLVFGSVRLVGGLQYTFSCDESFGSLGADFQLYNAFGIEIIVGGNSYGKSRTFTAPKTGSYTLCFWTRGAGIETGKTFRIQLELGSTATDYEPPSVSSATVNLSSNALRSLPAGTCDVLTIGEDGTAEIERAVGSVDIPTDAGDVVWEFAYQRIGVFLSLQAQDTTSNATGRLFCDKVPPRANGQAANVGTHASTSAMYAYIRVDGSASASDTVAKVGGGEVVYPRRQPDSVALPAVTLPALTGPTANVWAVATDGHGNTFTLQPEIELEYARDVTLVIGSLEAKVAALELLHETE